MPHAAVDLYAVAMLRLYIERRLAAWGESRTESEAHFRRFLAQVQRETAYFVVQDAQRMEAESAE